MAAPIIDAIGNGWLMTIMCVLGLSGLSTIWIMQKWGPRWREQAMNGDYASIGI